MERLAPYLERDEERARTMLSNRGIEVGSEAYNRGMDDLSRARNDARLAAVAAGGAEMANLYGLTADSRGRAIQEAMLERSQPINEIATLLGTAGPIDVANFGAVPQAGVAPADIAGATYASHGSAMNAYQQEMANRNAMMGGVFGIAKAATPFLFGVG